ncbi:coiled-coil domain-containing protein 194 [Suncus etruscus]|uniref:coiled-coil domain-containing protein 194 n=1 Tax=Suncus etruscus TaxID=109475 RepID=UPI00211029AF|nr:coiled-coil domain-containing protein 194 [Suncus etruscus]
MCDQNVGPQRRLVAAGTHYNEKVRRRLGQPVGRFRVELKSPCSLDPGKVMCFHDVLHAGKLRLGHSPGARGCLGPKGAARAGGMAGSGPEPQPEPGCAWRALALCGAAVFLAAAAAGGALLAWNLAASTSRGSRCPEPAPSANTTSTPAPPRDPALSPGNAQDELRRRLEELTRELEEAQGARQELQGLLRACESRQNQLETQLMMLKAERDEAKAQGTQMSAENGALTEALARWEAAATESAQHLEEAQQRAHKAEAEGGACAAREATLRERVDALEAEMDPRRKGSRPRPRPRPSPRTQPSTRSSSSSGTSKGCRRPRHAG